MKLEQRVKTLGKELAKMRKAAEKPAAVVRITTDRFIISSGGATLICLSKF